MPPRVGGAPRAHWSVYLLAALPIGLAIFAFVLQARHLRTRSTQRATSARLTRRPTSRSSATPQWSCVTQSCLRAPKVRAGWEMAPEGVQVAGGAPRAVHLTCLSSLWQAHMR